MKKALILLCSLFSIFPLTMNVTYASYDYMATRTEVVYDSNSGLPTGKANDIVQTPDGYIWIAQYVGLTKYNGKSFDTITSVNIGEESLGLSGITKLYVDEQGVLWAGTQ